MNKYYIKWKIFLIPFCWLTKSLSRLRVVCILRGRKSEKSYIKNKEESLCLGIIKLWKYACMLIRSWLLNTFTPHPNFHSSYSSSCIQSTSSLNVSSNRFFATYMTFCNPLCMLSQASCSDSTENVNHESILSRSFCSLLPICMKWIGND